MNNDQYRAQRMAHVANLDTLKMAALNAKAAGDTPRVKELNVQMAQIELILRKEFPRRSSHDPATLPGYFIDVCKQRLPPEQFAGLIEAAKRLQAADAGHK